MSLAVTVPLPFFNDAQSLVIAVHAETDALGFSMISMTSFYTWNGGKFMGNAIYLKKLVTAAPAMLESSTRRRLLPRVIP